MESLNYPGGIHFMLFLILSVSTFGLLAIILRNPLISALIAAVLVVSICELGRAYGWVVAGPIYGLLFVFLMAMVIGRYSSR